MNTEVAATVPSAPPPQTPMIPSPVTEAWVTDLRRRVLANDPMVTREELRAAREHIRQQHLAAGMVTRGTAKEKAEIAEVVSNTALDNW